jgi:dipeptidyl aminopeptidase/acylaminoacyl peptidase
MTTHTVSTNRCASCALGALLAIVITSGAALAQEVLAPENLTPPSGPHPFGPTDLWAMHRVADVVPSPDGAWVVYVETVYDVAANSSTKGLRLVSTGGGEPRQLTTPKDAKDYAPQWLPDGKTIAFISSRTGSTQIWAVRVDGGDPWQVSDLPVDVDNLRWSPAGDMCAFTAEVFAQFVDLKATADHDKKLADDKVQARIYDSLQMRHWDSWETGKRNHVFVARVKEGKLDGAPVDLLKGAEIDAPVRPFGGREEYAWSPDGSEIAFTGKEKEGDATRTDNDIYVAKTDGSSFRCITESNEAMDTAPVYSPDGSTIAYLAMKRPGYEADRYVVTLRDRSTGKLRELTNDWDRSPGALAWSSDGRTIFATAGDEARQRIFAIDVASGKVTPVIRDHFNGELSVARASGGDRLVFAQDSYTSPADIFTAKADGSDLRRLTNANASRLEGVELSTPEDFWFAGAQGDKVHGWIFKPAGYTSGKKYPVAFLIHGGPQGSFNDHFHYRWNPQCYAGAGYAVIAIDFHGSTGYGQAFTDAINKDWGGKPYEDLMLGLDYALENYKYLDASRVAGLGASYGGFMVFWIAGHTDRFQCLVAHDGSFDEVSAYYTTEELWFPEWEWGGPPWDKEAREVYERNSPERYVANWKTPMLVIHGAKDYRLLDSEGISAFTALQRRGIPSKFLHFPDENHWVLKPQNGLLWHETVLGWIDQWTKGEVAAKAGKDTKGNAKKTGAND